MLNKEMSIMLRDVLDLPVGVETTFIAKVIHIANLCTCVDKNFAFFTSLVADPEGSVMQVRSS